MWDVMASGKGEGTGEAMEEAVVIVVAWMLGG